MVNGGGWSPAKGSRRGNNYRNSGRFEGDRRGAVHKRVWDDLGRKKGKGFVDCIRESTTSFYFTNFPENARRSELWNVFSGAGNVVDVLIPSKVDKLGRRFGFVRFAEERDLPRLERRLQRVWLGTFKLQINRPHEPSNDHRDNAKVVEPVAEGVVLGQEFGADHLNPAVAKEVVGNPRWGAWQMGGGWKKKQPLRENNSFIMEYVVDEERVKKLSSCYVGILAESRSATALEFQHSLLMEGYHAIKATPMGGDSILLSSSVDDAIPDAINSNRNWWSSWLRGFSVWDLNLILSKRRV